MVNPLRYLTDSARIYEQALSDFGITELMQKLSNFSDPDFDASWMNLEQRELESLVTILIRGLTVSLKGKLMAAYVNAIRHGDRQELPNLGTLGFPPPSIELPANFPNVQTPRYLYGDKLRWIPEGDKTVYLCPL